MYVYMKVTEDELELPVAVADDVNELASIVGVSANTIYSAISHVESGRRRKSIYCKVEIGEENE